MYQRVTAAPQDPRTIFPEMPDYLASIILKCLERDPARRYQSAREVLDDLDAQNIPALSASATANVATTTTTSAPKAGPKPGSTTISIEIPKPTGRWGLAAGALALAAALVFAIPATRHLILGAPKGAAVSTQPTHYIAVLPVNYQGDEALSYIGDGVVDTLSAKLAGLKNVYVATGRIVDTAAKQKDDAQIAKMLGVTLLVRTTVQVSGDQVSVIVSMDKVGKDGGNLLKRQKDGSRQNLITLENEAFNVLVGGLQIQQTREELARRLRRLSPRPQSAARQTRPGKPAKRPRPVRCRHPARPPVRPGADWPRGCLPVHVRRHERFVLDRESPDGCPGCRWHQRKPPGSAHFSRKHLHRYRKGPGSHRRVEARAGPCPGFGRLHAPPRRRLCRGRRPAEGHRRISASHSDQSVSLAEL
jgi:TolB-like protein